MGWHSRQQPLWKVVSLCVSLIRCWAEGSEGTRHGRHIQRHIGNTSVGRCLVMHGSLHHHTMPTACHTFTISGGRAVEEQKGTSTSVLETDRTFFTDVFFLFYLFLPFQRKKQKLFILLLPCTYVSGT